jgi:predicted HTH domain antitoxin
MKKPEIERNIDLGINIYVTTKVTLWEAVKLRLAGAAYIQEMVKQRIEKHLAPDKEDLQ